LWQQIIKPFVFLWKEGNVKFCRKGKKSAGFYIVDFGSSSDRMASGIYIYRITASDKGARKNFSSVKEMMLLK
jgi:hypothetical protein